MHLHLQRADVSSCSSRSLRACEIQRTFHWKLRLSQLSHSHARCRALKTEWALAGHTVLHRVSDCPRDGCQSLSETNSPTSFSRPARPSQFQTPKQRGTIRSGTPWPGPPDQVLHSGSQGLSQRYWRTWSSFSNSFHVRPSQHCTVPKTSPHRNLNWNGGMMSVTMF